MSARGLESTTGESATGRNPAAVAGFSFVATDGGDGDILHAPPAQQGSAYFSALLDFNRTMERQSPAVNDNAVVAAASGADTAPVSDHGLAMTLGRITGRLYRALRRLQPMFPPMSCC